MYILLPLIVGGLSLNLGDQVLLKQYFDRFPFYRSFLKRKDLHVKELVQMGPSC
jgi:hypothetical protein